MIRYRLKELIADKEFLEKRKITLIEIAEKTGIARSTLSRLMSTTGYNTTTDVIDKLCKFFNCQTQQVAEYIPDPDA
jgi:putative transcriptional regulator